MVFPGEFVQSSNGRFGTGSNFVGEHLSFMLYGRNRSKDGDFRHTQRGKLRAILGLMSKDNILLMTQACILIPGRPTAAFSVLSPILLDASGDRPDVAEGEQLIHEGVKLRLRERKRGLSLDDQGLPHATNLGI